MVEGPESEFGGGSAVGMDGGRKARWGKRQRYVEAFGGFSWMLLYNCPSFSSAQHNGDDQHIPKRELEPYREMCANDIVQRVPVFGTGFAP